MFASLPKSLLGLLAIAFLIMGPAAGSARAGVAVAPLKQEITLKPGEEGKVTLLLSYVNRTQTDVGQAVKVSLEDVQAMEDGSLTFKDPGTQSTSASKWVTVDEANVTLEPGQSKSLECTVRVPMSAAPGEYYTVVMVTLAHKGVTDKGVAVQYRIASGIFVTVLGRTFPKEAKITECQLIWPEAPSATAPADAAKKMEIPSVRLVLQNTGKARFDAAGKITVYDAKQRWVLTAPFNSKRPMVFGGDSRAFIALLTKPLAPGKYTIRVEMDYQSAWSKAHQEFQVDILPEQAELLAAIKKADRSSAAIEALPKILSATVPPGASRTLAVALKDISEGTVTCQAIANPETAGSETWLDISSEPFTITKGGKKSLVVKVDVPAKAAPGKYSSTLTIDATVDGSESSQISIPVDIEVKAGR